MNITLTYGGWFGIFMIDSWLPTENTELWLKGELCWQSQAEPGEAEQQSLPPRPAGWPGTVAEQSLQCGQLTQPCTFQQEHLQVTRHLYLNLNFSISLFELFMFIIMMSDELIRSSTGPSWWARLTTTAPPSSSTTPCLTPSRPSGAGEWRGEPSTVWTRPATALGCQAGAASCR